MGSELTVIEHFDRMNDVVTEYLKGIINPSAIAKTLNMQRKEVVAYLDEWKALARSSSQVQDRAKDAIAGADQHYSMLIKEAWRTLEQADAQDALPVKTQALKLIADIEAKRIEMLNKAGVLENSDLTDQVLESERKQEILVSILKEVTASCDHCKWEVAKRLSEVTGQVEAVVVN